MRTKSYGSSGESATPLFAALAACAVLALPQASAQSGWDDFSRLCRQRDGIPHRGGEVAGHPTAWCEGGGAARSSGGSSSSEPNYGPVVGIIGAVVRGVQGDRDRRRRAAHNSAIAFNDQGIAASRAGNYEAAERYYAEAQRLWPDNATIARNLEGVRGRAGAAREQREQTAATQQAISDLTRDLSNDRRRRGTSSGLEFQSGSVPNASGGALDFLPSNASGARQSQASGASSGAVGVQLNPGARTEDARNLAPPPASALARSNTALEQLENATRQSVDRTFEDATPRTGDPAPIMPPSPPTPTPTGASDPVVPETLLNDARIVAMQDRRTTARQRIGELQTERATLSMSNPTHQVRLSEIDDQISTQEREEQYVNFEINAIVTSAGAATQHGQGQAPTQQPQPQAP